MKLYALHRFLIRIKHAYAPDLRALALMRIGVAFIVLVDLLIRMGDLSAFYTDQGIWPTQLIYNFGWKAGYWSLHALNGNYSWQLVLFSLHMLAATCLLFGYRTRMSTVLVWLLTISLHNRNLYILQAGDDLLRLTLFWGIFLPWQNHYSVDARNVRSSSHQSILAVSGYYLLIASVYIFSFFLKTGGDWREGSAVYYALSLEQLRLPGMGDFLYGYPLLMKMLSWIVLGLELLIPIFILYPSRNGRTRWWAFVMILILHAGISLHLYVGLFSIISIVTAIGLIPAGKIEWITSTFNWLRGNKQLMINAANSNLAIRSRNFFLIVVIIACLLMNLSTLPAWPYQLRSPFSNFVHSLRLDQHWGMFSPAVLKEDGWLVYEGIGHSGNTLDLRTGNSEVSFAKPAHIVSHYKNDRWRKLAENLQSPHYTFLRPLYADYVLNEWNQVHPEQPLIAMNLYFMEKTNLADYRSSDVRKQLLYASYKR
jgi:hypothetical protein